MHERQEPTAHISHCSSPPLYHFTRDLIFPRDLPDNRTKFLEPTRTRASMNAQNAPTLSTCIKARSRMRTTPPPEGQLVCFSSDRIQFVQHRPLASQFLGQPYSLTRRNRVKHHQTQPVLKSFLEIGQEFISGDFTSSLLWQRLLSMNSCMYGVRS